MKIKSEMKVLISDNGKKEIARLKFDIGDSIRKIIDYVPRSDVSGISHILITDTPNKVKGRNLLALAAYFRKYDNKQAYVEVYLKNLYSHIMSAESFSIMLPIQEYSLAITIFHEIGHHARVSITHNIRKDKSEKFASHYAEIKEKEYIAKNESIINLCFENLELMAQQGQLSAEVIKEMKEGWQRRCQELLKEG